jgi:hypothetical protein
VLGVGVGARMHNIGVGMAIGSAVGTPLGLLVHYCINRDP